MTTLTDQIEQWLVIQFAALQTSDPSISDGVLICAMARVQGALLKFADPEHKPPKPK